MLLSDESWVARPGSINRLLSHVLRPQQFRFTEKLSESIVNLHGLFSHVYYRWKNPEFVGDAEGLRIYDSPCSTTALMWFQTWVVITQFSVPPPSLPPPALPADVALSHYCRYFVPV